MGFFDKLLGRNPVPPSQGPSPALAQIGELQQRYWTLDGDELARLESRGWESLDWQQRLRLHHLNCLDLLQLAGDAATEKCRRSVSQLVAPDSPYRPRPAMVWQGAAAQPGSERPTDLQGELLNPSLTHFGCLEIYRVDEQLQPTAIDFVSFDELSGILFAPPSLLRGAKLFYDDGRGEVVLVPLLYGLTWTKGNEYDRDGRMTRFISHIELDEIAGMRSFGLGVGQQDLSICQPAAGSSLFGLGSVAEISFPLNMRDPRFDEKARARGIDPDDLRRQMGAA